MPSNLRIGCRVSAAVGPLKEVPGAAATTAVGNGGRQARRRRLRFTGTILRSMPGRQWTVLWDDNGYAGDHPSQTLRYEGAATTVYNEGDVVLLLAEKHLGNQTAFCRAVDRNIFPTRNRATRTTDERNETANSNVTTTNSNVTNNTTENCDTSVASTNSSSINYPDDDGSLSEATTETNASVLAPESVSGMEADEQEDNVDLHEEDNFDPQAILFDVMQAEQQGNGPADLLAVAREKEQLLGHHEEVTKGNRSATWVVRDDILPQELEPTIIATTPGLKGFDFNEKSVPTADKKGGRINTLKLIQHLWPGDWKQQVQNLNIRIQEANDQLRRGSNPSYRYCRLVSPKKFWVFWGLIIVARLEGRKGELWDVSEPEGYGNKVNVSAHMTRHRFKQLRTWFSFLWADDSRKETDEWWQISPLIDSFNENRKRTVSTGNVKVLDELMSSFHPQTLKTGNLPHLSFIQRKPEPLGTEFKVVADTKTQLFTFMELQRGKDEMAEKEFVNEMLKTAACTTRLAKYSLSSEQQEGKRETYIGDSWFASVNTVVSLKKNLDVNFIGVIKTASNRYPKQFLQKTMQHWPAGSHLVLESTIEDVPMIAMGYKYNQSKTIYFIFMKGAGHTLPGKPYEARWKDENNNTRSTNIPRPQVASVYFDASNVIDVANQSRQHDLRLEKHWISSDGYFRIATTFFGVCMTDAWRAYRFHIHRNHRHFDMQLEQFAGIVAKDMLANNLKSTPIIPDNFSLLGDMMVPDTIAVDNSTPDQLSTLGNSQQTGLQLLKEISESVATHTLKRNCEQISYTVKEKNGNIRAGKRIKRNRCFKCGKKTAYFCQGCRAPSGCKQYWLCGGNRDCFDTHLNEVCKGFCPSN